MAKRVTTAGKSLTLLRELGYVAGSVERRYGGFSYDFLGGIDIIAIKGDETLAVQTTSVNCGPEHLKKLQSLPEMKLWLLGRGRRLELWTWKRYKVKRGGKRVEWRCNRYELLLSRSGSLFARARIAA